MSAKGAEDSAVGEQAGKYRGVRQQSLPATATSVRPVRRKQNQNIRTPRGLPFQTNLRKGIKTDLLFVVGKSTRERVLPYAN